MIYSFKGDVEGLKEGIEILSSRLGFTVSDGGIDVKITKRAGNLEIISDGNAAEIRYEDKIHFFRALGILFEHKNEKINIVEDVKFKKNGVMIDSSRNGVLKPSSIKKLMENMALMGLNFIMMYTEDTYEVPEYEYFGYMRGRFTYEEMRECDAYAEIFGIEMIPCIQTLAHLSKALKWQHNLKIRDTEDSLYVGEKDTYTFVKNLLKAATKPFRSKRVHIGMDEAWSLGLGKYLKENGYKPTADIILEHFKTVVGICDELGIEPIMWSDMFFRAGSPTNEYYDVNASFSEDIIKNIPKNVGLIYWDYYHTEKELYSGMIKKHRELSDYTIFGGGIWVWGNMVVNYKKTLDVSVPALKACIENNVSEVFACMWGDNSNQTNDFEALYGMQLYAEMGYGHEPTEEHLAKRFKACTGESAEAFLSLSSLDYFGQEDYENANPSEYLLWQDILIGLLDSHVDRDDLADIYSKCKAKMKKNAEESKNYKDIFEYAYSLSNVLEIKADLGVRLKRAYDSGNKCELGRICNETLPELKNRVNEFKNAFRKLWFSYYKVFGYEVIDMRFGALLQRIETAELRISQYLNGEISVIEELVPERLPYKLADGQYGEGLNLRTLSHNLYVSAGYCSHGFFD